MIRNVLWWLMDHACAATGHRLRCYNEPRWLNRVWFWSLGPDA